MLTIITFLCGSISISTLQAQQGRSNAPGLNKDDAPKEKAKNERPPTKKPLDRKRADYQVIEAGPHHRKWERIDTITNELGEEEERIHGYTELGTGLNRWDEEKAEWIEASNVIEAFEGGAVARSGQTKVIFAPRLGDPEGTVDILTDDGERIRTVVLGLSYFDPVSGDDVVLSEVNPDVMGEILPPNRVIYRNAFTDIDADVIYEYRRDRFSQNIVLHESPADPSEFGLSKLSRLEVLSEILEAPKPVKEVRVVKELAKNLNERSQMAEPDLIDETIRFTGSSIGKGKAFDIGDRPGTEAIVTKRWIEDAGRTVLFEGIEVESTKEALNRLPRGQEKKARNRAGIGSMFRHGPRKIPTRRYAQVDSNQRFPLKIASASTFIESGYLIDYEILVSSISNYTFKAGETYHIANTLYAYGKTTFEGGAVVKNSYSSLNLEGDLSFPTDSFSPVIFTSVHDDSVGEIISGSSGVPLAASYNSWAIRISGTSYSDLVIQNARVSYAKFGINSYASHRLTVRNVQIKHSTYGLGGYWSDDGKIENALFSDCLVAVSNIYGSQEATNVTFDNLDYLYFGPSLELKNSLLVNIGSIAPYTRQGQSDNVELANSMGIFQSVGGGSYYLANGSPFRNVGISQIDPPLIELLEQGTTFPPSVLPENQILTSNAIWSPQVARDNDGVFDLGYHYPAIDYLLNDTEIGSGAALTVNAGTHFGWYGSRGITLQEAASVQFLGTVSDPIRVGWYGDLQDGTDPVRVDPISHVFFEGHHSSPVQNQNSLYLAHIQMEPGSYQTDERYFVNVANPANEGFGILTIQDSRIHGLRIKIDDSQGHLHTIFNSEFRRGFLTLRGDQSFDFRHNHLFAALVDIDQNVSANQWTLRENVFDAPALGSASAFTNAQLDYNGYVNTGMRLGNSSLPNDVILPYLGFEEGPFGSLYQPASSLFIDAGSRLADAAGLLHHTVLEGGSPEGDDTSVSVVDIGVHYPAVDGNGELLDADGDSAPNIHEDLNGNGTVDLGETPWAPGPPPPPPVVYTFEVFTPLDH